MKTLLRPILATFLMLLALASTGRAASDAAPRSAPVIRPATAAIDAAELARLRQHAATAPAPVLNRRAGSSTTTKVVVAVVVVVGIGAAVVANNTGIGHLTLPAS